VLTGYSSIDVPRDHVVPSELRQLRHITANHSLENLLDLRIHECAGVHARHYTSDYYFKSKQNGRRITAKC
jgi:hypothetical protein